MQESAGDVQLGSIQVQRRIALRSSESMKIALGIPTPEAARARYWYWAATGSSLCLVGSGPSKMAMLLATTQ
jgi:hypothetical protein